MTSVKEHFFSDRNLQFTYESVRQELNHKHDYDINSSPKLRQGFKQIAEAVYTQTNSADRSLTSLNDNLTTKSIAYFGKVIDTKKGRKTNISGNQINGIEIARGTSTRDTFNSELGMSVMNNNSDVSSNLEKLRLDRDNSVAQMPQQNMNTNMNTNMESRYISTMAQRQDQIQQEEVGHKTGRQMAELYEGNSNPDYPFDTQPMGQPEVSVLPMLYSSDFLDDSNNVMYNNTDQLKARDGMNPMDLLGKYQQSRDMESEQVAKLMNQRPMDNLAEKRNKQLVDSRVDIVSADPRKLMFQEQDITERVINNMTASTVGDNDNLATPNRKSANERAMNTMVNYQIANEPKYIDKVHYININSIDRNWISQQESRYQYKVNFDQSETQSGAGIASLMRNILSVELVNAMLPLDNTPVLFDNRIYLSTHRNPYLLLHVDELDGVFRSTHNASDKVFSQMIFDKEYSSSALSSDYVASDVVSAVTRYSPQFNRGYLRYIPAFFEKKTNYNNPMASLNRMTIRITDLYGNLINTESDVLEISTIVGEDVANQELVGTIGFPGYNVATAGFITQYIKITTTKYFSNRLFRIGDCIQFSGIITDNGNMTDFINRDAGHIIINLVAEATGPTDNKGYINVIYIAPLGNLNSDNQTLDYSTYIDPNVAYTSFNSISTGTSIKGYLINKFLQTNLMMKIITRDVDTENIIKSLNV